MEYIKPFLSKNVVFRVSYHVFGAKIIIKFMAFIFYLTIYQSTIHSYYFEKISINSYLKIL